MPSVARPEFVANDDRRAAPPPANIEYVLPQLLSMARGGERVVLATLIARDGSSPRPLGSQLAVNDAGRYFGYITGGCAEAAIVAEAKLAMDEHENRITRFGKGSCYIDITLPCGAGVDVFFDVGIDEELITYLDTRVARRQVTALETNVRTGEHAVTGGNTAAAPDRDVFRRWYLPVQRLQIFGKGPVVPALASQACAANYAVTVVSPEEATLEAVADLPLETAPLQAYTSQNRIVGDPWTASVTLFHEHDLEIEILRRLFASDSYYIGALGSRKTHDERVRQLRNTGLGDAEIARIHAPIGLSIGAVSAAEIATSIMAELVARQRETAVTEFEYGPC